MLDKILVDREAVGGLPYGHPFRLNIEDSVAFLQEQDIGRDFCPSVRAECCVGQADGSQQVGTLREKTPYGAVFLVHRVARGYESNHAARTHKIECFRKEIVVNMKVMPVIFRIVDLV